MAGEVSEFGEAFAGSGPEAAHINTVLGIKGGPVETAWSTALATPREGHVAFVVVAQPNIPVLPMTLFVNKATIASERHATLTWGAAQLGVARGVLDAHERGHLSTESLSSHLLIVAAWVDPGAESADDVYENNKVATTQSLARGARRGVDLDELVSVRDSMINGYYAPPSS